MRNVSCLFLIGALFLGACSGPAPYPEDTPQPQRTGIGEYSGWVYSAAANSPETSLEGEPKLVKFVDPNDKHQYYGFSLGEVAPHEVKDTNGRVVKTPMTMVSAFSGWGKAERMVFVQTSIVHSADFNELLCGDCNFQIGGFEQLNLRPEMLGMVDTRGAEKIVTDYAVPTIVGVGLLAGYVAGWGGTEVTAAGDVARIAAPTVFNQTRAVSEAQNVTRTMTRGALQSGDVKVWERYLAGLREEGVISGADETALRAMRGVSPEQKTLDTLASKLFPDDMNGFPGSAVRIRSPLGEEWLVNVPCQGGSCALQFSKGAARVPYGPLFLGLKRDSAAFSLTYARQEVMNNVALLEQIAADVKALRAGQHAAAVGGLDAAALRRLAELEKNLLGLGYKTDDLGRTLDQLGLLGATAPSEAAFNNGVDLILGARTSEQKRLVARQLKPRAGQTAPTGASGNRKYIMMLPGSKIAEVPLITSGDPVRTSMPVSRILEDSRARKSLPLPRPTPHLLPAVIGR